MFPKGVNLERIQTMSKNTLMEQIGIEVTEIGEDYIKGKMPVDHRTHQPFGLLHGGASVALAETLGSLAASLTVDPSKQRCVGLEINANHLKAVRDGNVEGVAKPVHVGKRTQVWEIKISNEANELVCISRITMAVIDNKKG